IFGGAAISRQRAGTDIAGAGSAQSATFELLETLPWFVPIAILVMLLVSIFFVSGADAASVVMGTLSQRGSVHPRKGVVVFWGVLMGAVAAVMLLVGGNEALTGLQNLTILIAVPFLFVMVGLCVSVWMDLRHDPLMQQEDAMMRSLKELHEERTDAAAERRRLRGRARH
ncbi:BCCT family transporter, partial [Amycolatopsis sp.]|uniref:BCCT family transporter n=1 Tax=Amycolatopsis sp. TaxID=37632 RepID=UPI002D7EF8A4